MDAQAIALKAIFKELKLNHIAQGRRSPRIPGKP